MSTISLRCTGESDAVNCVFDHGHKSIYIYVLQSLAAGMSLTNIDTKTPMSADPAHMLAIGLGGGRLHTYAVNHHPALHIDTVEISSNMLQMAQTYFGLQVCDIVTAYSDKKLRDFMQQSFISERCRSRVILADGSAFLAEAAKQKKVYDFVHIDMYDARVVDYVGDNGVGDGNSVTPELLLNVARVVHPSKGIALIYLIDDAQYDNYVTAVQRLFKRVIHLSVSGNSHILAAAHWEELGIAPGSIYRKGELNIDVPYLAQRVSKYASDHNYDSRLANEYKYVFKDLQ